MSLANSVVVMRLSEAITIYLATGAPFSIDYFLRPQTVTLRARQLLRAVATGLFWPLVVVRTLVTSHSRTAVEANLDKVSRMNEDKILAVKRRSFAAIHSVLELGRETNGTIRDELDRAAYVLRESIETYVGLASATDKLKSDDSPDENMKELFRVAGRSGDDLLLAARCAHRRNATRIVERYNRARLQIVHSIMDLQEVFDLIQRQRIAESIDERRLRSLAAELYTCAFDLLSLMGDEEAALRVAGLLNRELSRLRRLEIMKPITVPTPQIGGEPCKTVSSRPSRTHLSSKSTLARG